MIAQEPRVSLMQDERFALGKDEQTTFINCEGKMNLQVNMYSCNSHVLVLFACKKIKITSKKGIEAFMCSSLSFILTIQPEVSTYSLIEG